MYRIELAPGEETVFRTIEEFAVAVRNGLVSSRSRIYHSATQKWLPIEFHPHYKKALELSAHRQDIPATRVPERLDTLNFAVPRPAPAAAAAEPLTEPLTEPPTEKAAKPDVPWGKPVAEHTTEPRERAVVPAGDPAESAPKRVELSQHWPESPNPAPVHEPAARAELSPLPPPVVPPQAVTPIAPRRATPRMDARLFDLPVIAVAEESRGARSSGPHAGVAVEARVAVALAEEQVAAAQAPAQPAVPSPVLQFPAIVYPEITPAEPPVAEPVTEAARKRRPFHVAGALLVLGLGAYGMMSFAPSRNAGATTSAVADLTASPAPAHATPADVPPAAPATAKAVVMTQPATSGFAPALESRAIVTTAPAPGVTAPSTATATKDSSLAPAPADLQLDLPALPGADSLLTAPKQQGDSAMKRILRAVNGGKELPTSR